MWLRFEGPGPRPGGLIGASRVEGPAFTDDGVRGQVSQEGDAGDPEAPEPLGGVGPQDGFPGLAVGDEHDHGHQGWCLPGSAISTVNDRSSRD